MKAVVSGVFRSLQSFNCRFLVAGGFGPNVGTGVQRITQDWLVLTNRPTTTIHPSAD